MTLPELLKKTVELEGSDLHITINTPPQVRIHGHLQRLEGGDMTPSDTKALTYSVLTDAQKKRYREALQPDFSFGIQGLARFRCNTFTQRVAVAAALRISETGHLTFGTLHTNSAAQTINRIIDVFPAHQPSQIRTQLSLVHEGIVCQALLPKLGGGRVCSLEIMVPTPGIRNLI